MNEMDLAAVIAKSNRVKLTFLDNDGLPIMGEIELSGLAEAWSTPPKGLPKLTVTGTVINIEGAKK